MSDPVEKLENVIVLVILIGVILFAVKGAGILSTLFGAGASTATKPGAWTAPGALLNPDQPPTTTHYEWQSNNGPVTGKGFWDWVQWLLLPGVPAQVPNAPAAQAQSSDPSTVVDNYDYAQA